MASTPRSLRQVASMCSMSEASLAARAVRLERCSRRASVSWRRVRSRASSSAIAVRRAWASSLRRAPWATALVRVSASWVCWAASLAVSSSRRSFSEPAEASCWSSCWMR